MHKVKGKAATAFGTLALALAGGPEASAADDQRQLSVVLTGQVMLQSDFRFHTPGAVAAIRPLLQGDVVFSNFETTVKKPTDSLAHLVPAGGVYAPPESIDAMKDLGVNLLALPNNHSYDMGEVGVLNTLERVKTVGVVSSGMGRTVDEARSPAYLQTAKAKVDLVSMASGLIRAGGRAEADHPGVNELRLIGAVPGVEAGSPHPEDSAAILGSIREAARNADLVVAYQHNHAFNKNFVQMMVGRMPERQVPPPWIRQWARQEIQAGADIVVLHGAPLLQGVEIYEGRPIFYGLGNFIFQLPVKYEPHDMFDAIVFESVVVRAQFVGKALRSITFTPVLIDEHGRGDGELKVATRGLPTRAHGTQAQAILQRLVELSRPMGSEIVIRGDVAELQLPASRATAAAPVPARRKKEP